MSLRILRPQRRAAALTSIATVDVSGLDAFKYAPPTNTTISEFAHSSVTALVTGKGGTLVSRGIGLDAYRPYTPGTYTIRLQITWTISSNAPKVRSGDALLVYRDVSSGSYTTRQANNTGGPAISGMPTVVSLTDADAVSDLYTIDLQFSATFASGQSMLLWQVPTLPEGVSEPARYVSPTGTVTIYE